MRKRRVKKRTASHVHRPSHGEDRMLFSVDHLESRVMLAHLFIDYGDNFAGGTLTTTQGAFRDVANSATPDERILGTTLTGAGGSFNAGTQLDIVAQTFTATERAEILAIVQRAYAPLDVEVVDLTATAQTTSDGRSVAGATSMADVVTTLRGGAAASKDAYIFVGTFVVDPGGANQQVYTGGGGLSPTGTILGETNDRNAASNVHDDVAVVYSSGGRTNNTINNISHEAGHNFGLRHAITNATNNATTNLFHQAEIMSYRNTNNTTSSMFARYPMIRGDGNSPMSGVLVNYDDLAARNGFQTTHDQLVNDGTIGANPNFTFVSGTGAHDIITVVKNGAIADVTVQAFADPGYTTAIEVPGLIAGGTYSYSIPLTKTILIYGGDSNDQFVIDGDLGVDVLIDGMRGTDSLTLDGKGTASASFTPDSMAPIGTDLIPDFGGIIGIDGTTITLRNFDTMGSVAVNDVQMLSYLTTGAGNDDLEVELTGTIASEITGTINGGTGVIPLSLDGDLTTLSLVGGPGTNVFAVSASGGLAAMQESFLVGGSADSGSLIFDLDGSAGAGGSGLLNGDELTLLFGGFQTFDTSTTATNFDVFLTNMSDNARFESGGLLEGVQSTRVVDVGGTFATFRYTNKQDVTLDALGGGDVIANFDPMVANGEASKTLIGNDGNDTFQLGGSDSTALGNMGNDVYEIVDDSSVATITIGEELGEGSDTVDFSSLATPAMATEQSGTGLAMAGNAMVEVAAAGQQKNIEFGINAAPFVAYTLAPPIGVPFMTMNYEVEYVDVGTMSTHTATFDWGDGSTDPGVVMGAQGMGTATGSHQFDTVDTFNVIAIITDDENLSKSDVAMTTIQQFALLPDQKNPALTALYVGGTVGIDVIKFKSLNNGDIRAILNGAQLGEFSFDGSIFAYGGSGNDLITPIGTITKTLCFEGGGDVDVLRGSDGDDFLMGQGGKDTIVGRKGNDTIDGGTERDYLFGHDGDDTILAGIGNDVVKGGNGADYVDGGSGNDVIFGQAGDDLLLGRGNNDKLIGGAGDDVIGGGSGIDTLSGGGGNDLLIGEATTHDSDPMAWMSIRDEWVFSAATIPIRMANIMVGGGLNGANILASGVTVFDDGQIDKLASGGGTDWYLVFPIDNAQGVSGVDVVSVL